MSMLVKSTGVFAVKLPKVGRRKLADPKKLFALADDFYRQFDQLDNGTFLTRFNQPYYRHLAAELEGVDLPLTEVEKKLLHRIVDERIRTDRLKVGAREGYLRDLEERQLFAKHFLWRDLMVDEAMDHKEIPAERDTVTELLKATTPEQVLDICNEACTSESFEVIDPKTLPLEPKGEPRVEPPEYREARIPNSPIGRDSQNHLIFSQSTLPRYLAKYRNRFIEAKNDRRYPSSDRQSSRSRKLWFLSCALAGAICGIETRTAVDCVGSRRPKQRPQQSRTMKRN